MYRNILFDLDGTLTDPGLGITNSVMYALKKFGIDATDRASLYKFIGPPLSDSFARYYGMSQEDSLRAVDYYREYFKPKGLYENEVYDGVRELLAELKRQGRRIILATSKPEEFAVEILKHFGLHPFFDFVAGATMDGSRKTKGDVIAHALTACKITDLNSALMVGDREHDIIGAKENGLRCVGVLYGYGDLAELRSAGADYIAAAPLDILTVLAGAE